MTAGLSHLNEFQQRMLGEALANIERPPPDVLPASEKFWAGVAAAMKLQAAALGMEQEETDWIAREALRRLRDVPYCPPDKIRRKEIPVVVAGLYQAIGRKMFEVLRDWRASAMKG
jgi:hypothetical protein